MFAARTFQALRLADKYNYINNRRFGTAALIGVTKLTRLVTLKKAVVPKRRLFIMTSYSTKNYI